MSFSGFKKFLRNTTGNVGITLAVAAIPVVGAAGVAVDLVKRNQVEARVQAAVDAGALAGASMSNATADRIRTAVIDFADANGVGEILSDPSMLNIAIDSDGTVSVEAIGTIDTTLSQVLGVNTLNITAHAQARRGSNGAEIALVLDNTKSMEDGGKINALKSAAQQFVTTLTDLNNGSNPDRVKISVVPYAQYVNVGLHNRSATWMNVPPSTTIHWTNCEIPGSEHYVGTGEDAVLTYNYYSNPADCRTDSYAYEWHGCAGSREAPYNTTDNRPDLRFFGPRHVYCPTPLTTLTSNESTLQSAITAMHTNIQYDIKTYIPSGLAWGWRSLSSASPFTQGVSETYAAHNGISKHIVLMTDGVNTVAKNELPNDSGFIEGTTTRQATDEEWLSQNFRSDASAKADADQITAQLCSNIKSAGITIHAVAFQVSDSTTQDLLRNCASSPSNYYDADNAAQLASSFETIAGRIASVRLSQ